ncbi:cytidine deaminase-like protein [Xylariaceae sp. FL0016]|nr:cytidine deaminase-like protein [Xylariaceae sp. FL0016]
MASQSSVKNPATLLKALLSIIEHQIIPLTANGVSSGSKLFGAAILSKDGLNPLTVSTNNEAVSPLLHGEINCIQQFFAQDQFPTSSGGSSAQRPSPKECIFLATHEPCSLCLSGITWSGFDNFYYLFTYEDSRDLFAIPYDIQILEEVFRVPAEGEDENMLRNRPLYNKTNKFFSSQSFIDLIDEIQDIAEKEELATEVKRVKTLYDSLSNTYQEGKQEGVKSASVWK